MEQTRTLALKQMGREKVSKVHCGSRILCLSGVAAEKERLRSNRVEREVAGVLFHDEI